ncbi:MAG: SanA protein [Bacillota bacterium]|jgi:vancomycin permeability regulator SanA|nr:SanA protein [Bacillota bacterium]
MQIQKKKKRIRMMFLFVLLLGLLALTPFCISAYVVNTAGQYLINEEAAADLNADCILVLGAGLRPDGSPNLMLKDRLDQGLALYFAGAAPKLLLTGDNGQEQYDEVNAMKQYVLDAGVPAEDIFLDHAGFSTYESMYRARDIFEVKRAIVVTQKYHQFRAVYAAIKLGMEAYGVSAVEIAYAGQDYREFREVLARTKDFFKLIVKPEPTYLGEAIPISGSGLLSHD